MSVKEEINNLHFRRQYLLSSKESVHFENWRHNTIGLYHLYTHPDTEITTFLIEKDNLEIALIGFIIDPGNPNASNRDIIEHISENISIKTISQKLYHYAGRYVLLLKTGTEYFSFHDPCGLKMIFYTRFENKLYLASQPSLLKLVVPVKEGDRFKQYQESKYKKLNIEHWIPSGCSLYENVYQLTPNHYLDFSNSKQIRYWPNRALKQISLEEGVEKASELLKKIMIACNARFKMALPITGGFDSRTILSACKDIAPDTYFFTLQYRDLKEDSNDIKIPKRLLSQLGLTHHILDCRKSAEKSFADIYISNSDISHLADWGHIAYGMLSAYPSDRVAIKGSCSEIARGGFISSGKPIKIHSATQLIKFIPGWEQMNFINVEVAKWFSETKDIARDYEYDIQNLFYWEHRMGSWQAQSQLEWDIIHETVTPFNNRELLDISLSVNLKYRLHPAYKFYREVMRNLWSEVLVEPINPRPFYHKIKVLYNIIKKQIETRWHFVFPFFEMA